jgi:hypothetical protein
LDKVDAPWRLWHKEHADDQEHTWDELHGKGRNPLSGVGFHVSLDAIADPEANACSRLDTDLVDTNEATADRRRGQFSDIERNNSASKTDTLSYLLATNPAEHGIDDLPVLR